MYKKLKKIYLKIFYIISKFYLFFNFLLKSLNSQAFHKRLSTEVILSSSIISWRLSRAIKRANNYQTEDDSIRRSNNRRTLNYINGLTDWNDYSINKCQLFRSHKKESSTRVDSGRRGNIDFMESDKEQALFWEFVVRLNSNLKGRQDKDLNRQTV